MKILLACLMCLVLGASQCFAIKGGPVYPGVKDISGTFAGVLTPIGVGQNALGIFTVGIPQAGQTGLSSGAFLVFTGERTFTGTIQGIGDPNRGTLRAVLQGIPFIPAGTGTVTTLNVDADGFLTASVIPSSSAAFSVFGTLLLEGPPMSRLR
jgi:hypothetical protein